MSAASGANSITPRPGKDATAKSNLASAKNAIASAQLAASTTIWISARRGMTCRRNQDWALTTTGITPHVSCSAETSIGSRQPRALAEGMGHLDDFHSACPAGYTV